jgi:DNA excision repair protein ERCC-6
VIKRRNEAKIEALRQKVGDFEQTEEEVHTRMSKRQAQDGGIAREVVANSGERMPNESQRDFLIRTGKITPFSKISQPLKAPTNLEDMMMNIAAGSHGADEEVRDMPASNGLSHQNLRKPGFADDEDGPAIQPKKRKRAAKDSPNESSIWDEPATEAIEKRRRVKGSPNDDSGWGEPTGNTGIEGSIGDSGTGDDDEAFEPHLDDRELAALGEDDDDEEGDFYDDEENGIVGISKKGKKSKTRGKRVPSLETDAEDFSGLDDGNNKVYTARLEKWVKDRAAAREAVKRRRAEAGATSDAEIVRPDTREEWFRPHPSVPDMELDYGFRIPGDISPSLFDYQQTGVQWMCELYEQQCGGILGDQMGLGKTIQMIGFLAALHYSGKLNKPIIIVCPATVMKQWVKEFHTWWPPMRVSILHTSGSGMLNVAAEELVEGNLENEHRRGRKVVETKSRKGARAVVQKVISNGGVLITTYAGLKSYGDLLIPMEWGYAVLDEGHKIRNPDAEVTIYCKELKTPNRLILSGTPMQNNMTELWSLFDFVYPMRLGDLVSFKNQFAIPIRQGGFANASNTERQIATKCAEVLKDTISPYLLQRMKADVAADLPQKTEQVLFVKLVKAQKDAYRTFCNSADVQSILRGRRNPLWGVDGLRKICNHPDLLEKKILEKKPNYKYGDGKKSGKMQTVKNLLGKWQTDGRKTLLFCQTRQMLDILETFIKEQEKFKYMRMDGNTPIKDRQDLVDKFNNTPDITIFLLTTKVGGLGVNLTGADTVIIFDPDWNPSTDSQAQERAWRLGQKKPVTIYRLMTANTIEEKIYHRQVFKTLLTNKVLRDPTQDRSAFMMNDLSDFFSINDLETGKTETGELFEGAEVRFDLDPEASEISALPGVHGLENFKDVSKPDPDEDSEDRLMRGLFASVGVTSGIDHDAIINGTKKVVADQKMIEREASRRAAEAGAMLRRAEAVARNVPAGVPTWTGHNGETGRIEPHGPISRRGNGMSGRGGPSAASVLANLATGPSAVGYGSRTSPSTSSRTSTPVARNNGRRNGRKKEVTLQEIRDYLRAQPGDTPSSMIVSQFGHRTQDAKATADFKSNLAEIAEFVESSRGARGGSFRLKEEYC